MLCNVNNSTCVTIIKCKIHAILRGYSTGFYLDTLVNRSFMSYPTNITFIVIKFAVLTLRLKTYDIHVCPVEQLSPNHPAERSIIPHH